MAENLGKDLSLFLLGLFFCENFNFFLEDVRGEPDRGGSGMSL